MGHINVAKNTVVKNTPETFELIKELFKANGVDTDYTGFGHARAKLVRGDDEVSSLFIGFFTSQAIALQKQPKPQPTNYRKVAQTEPWEVVKRWQEDGDLYAQHSMSIDGFAKIRHIQQLAQLISQDRIYERVSELDVFVTRASETPILGSLSRDDVVQLFGYGLRFDDE